MIPTSDPQKGIERFLTMHAFLRHLSTSVPKRDERWFGLYQINKFLELRFSNF